MSSNVPTTQASENSQEFGASSKEPSYKPKERLPALEGSKASDNNGQEEGAMSRKCNSGCPVSVPKEKERKLERIPDPISCG